MKPKLNQKIYIVDCDFLYETSVVPNYKALKLSSYHKQLGDEVTFITEEYQLTGKHDILYLLRELRHTPFPPGDILDDRRTILMGKEFQLFEDAQELSLEAALCRPDYDMYPLKFGNVYEKANFVQFFNGNALLKNKQDWHRATSKCTAIVDDNLWDAPPSIIAQCFEEIRFDQNIIFLHPIKLKKLIHPEVYTSFCKLKLAKFGKIRYNNNIGEDFDSVAKAIEVISTIKKRFSYLNVNSIPVKIITKDHWDTKENRYYDFERCLKIMTYAQKNKVRINFRYPRMRLSSPSWFYFEFFKTWSNHLHTFSYIEALLKGAAEHNKKSYVDVLNNERLWTSAKSKQAAHLISNFPELIKEYGFVGWGGTISQSSERIDYAYVKEKAIENHIF